VAIFAPGGYLLAPKPEHVHWYRHLGSLLLAHWLRLPVILLGCSIGPFHGRLNGWLARWVLNRADLIIAREEISVAILNETQVTRPRVHLTTDIAFLLEADPDALPDPVRALLTARSGTLKIGISIRSYDFHGHPTPQTQAEHYVTSMASLVRHVIEVHHATVFMVPQVTVPRDDDTEITQLVAKLSGVNGDDLALIDGDLSPSELKGLYGAMDLFVGVRMHANIFALAAGVPTLAIAYEPKTRGIMRRLGLSDFVIGIRELDEGSLVERFDCLFQSRQDIRERLAAVLPEVRREAARSADIAAEYLAGLKERDDSVAKAIGRIPA
jgi:colanic acid/amylovoran biosynthesis protein